MAYLGNNQDSTDTALTKVTRSSGVTWRSEWESIRSLTMSFLKVGVSFLGMIFLLGIAKWAMSFAGLIGAGNDWFMG